ncbi:MAG: hypothetical protein KF810_12215 [Rhizobiaceae bacterium]|nr:hypothetical protein [Rhizobiaceae bacterium]
MTDTTAAPESTAFVRSTFMMKVFCVFTALALISLFVSIGGKQLGRSIALAGHTESTAPQEVVIGNDVLSVPANMIRFEEQRRDGVANRLDLYLRWPQLDGYSDAAKDDFNHANSGRSIIFVSFGERMMSRDMSGRLQPIYSSMIIEPGQTGPAGTRIYEFNEKSGYLNEALVVARTSGAEPFVARCLVGENAAESLQPCERDVHIGKQLSLTYRFPRELLADWGALDREIRAKAVSLLKSDG